MPTSAKAGALEKVGLTAKDVVMAGSNAAPHLEQAAQAALQGKYEEALGHLKDAATSSPDIAEKAVRGLAENLPDGAAKTLLTDKAVVHELLTNSDLHASVGKLIQNPTDLGAVRELVGNDKARDATLTALGKDPGVQAQLEKIGLTSQDLVQAGKAAPHLIDSFQKLQSGDVKGGLADFQKAVEASPDLSAKLGQKLLDQVPAQVKDQFAKLGITPEALQKAGPALPKLYEAADAAVKGDWKGAYSAIKDAAATAPDLATQALKGLAKQLPDNLGAAKSLLTNDGFLKELVTNKDLQGSLKKLVGGDTSAIKELLTNDKARDAALTAIGNDPGIKANLAKAGLTPDDLVAAGKAAPQVMDAFDKLQSGDVKGALTDFQKAVETSPELASKLGQKLLDKVPTQIKDQFAKLGITPEALQKAGPALPKLYEAADAAVKGDWKGAYSAIKDAAAAAPDLATQALKGLAKQLPDNLGAAKSLLTNDGFLKELVTNKDLQGSLEKLVGGDTSAIKELLTNDKARDAALTAIGNDPGIKANLAKAGLTPDDLVAAGKAAPQVMDAFDKLQSGDVKGALTDFQKAVETSPELASKLGQKLLDKVPTQIKDQFAKLGITPEALQKAGPALPKLYEAADAAVKGDWKGAYSAIKDAAAAAPDLATQALKGLAKQLPDNLGAAKSLLTNDGFLKELVTNKDLQGSLEKLVGGDTSAIKELLTNDKARDAALTAIGNDPGVKAQLDKVGLTPDDLMAAGKAAPQVMDAFDKLQSGDVKGALTDFQKAVETSPELASKLGQKLLDKVPTQIKDQFAKLGITPEALQKAGPALPKLYEAADAAVKGDWKGAYSAIKDAAAAAPDLATQALKGLAKQLPDNLGAAKSLLTNDGFLKELVTNKDLQGSLEKLVGGDTSAIKELLNNDKARDAALTAIGNDPGVKAQLDKVGLTPDDLVAAGKAAPQVMDAFDKLQSGDVKGALTDFQKAVETSPELASKLGQKLLDKVPTQIKDQFAKLGITPEALQKAGPALPKLYEAADAAVKGDWKGAYSAIKDAAAAAPDLATQALKGLAKQLPDSLGAAKSLLTNDGFLKELVTNKDLQGSLEKLVGGDISGIHDLLTNDKARDAALTAIGNDPGIKAQLDKVGLTPDDLVAAGKAAPQVMDAFDKLQSGDVKGALTDFQKAVETSPELASKLGQKLLDKVPPQIKDQFAKLGITPEALQKAGPALPKLYEAADAAVKGDWKGAYSAIKDAAAAAPDLATQALKGLAKQLPDSLGAAKSLLTNDGFLKELVTNKDLQGSLEKLVGGDTSAIKELLNNDKARDAALTAIGNDPGVKANLAKIGLTPDDLVEAGKAAPKLIEAFEQISAGNIKEGLLKAQEAVEAAPELAAKLGQKLVDKLPAEVKQQFAKLGITEDALRTAGPALPHLYDAVESVSIGDWKGALDAVREAGIAAPDLATQALKGLANQLPENLGAVKTLLTNDAFLKELVTNKDLHDQVGKLFNDSTRMEGIRGLLGNDKARDAALHAIASDPGVKAGLDKMGLTPDDLVEAGKAAPQLFDAMKSFGEGNIEAGVDALGKAAEAAPNLLDKIGQKVISKLPEGVRNAINGLGLTPSELAQSAKALPDLIRAGQAIAANDPQAALLNLKNAAGKIPSSIVEKAITTMASKLPDAGFAGMAKSLLTDPSFVKELVNNKDLHASFEKMMKGDFVNGLKEMLGNPAVRTAAANALASNKEIMDKLKPFGVQSGADIAALGGAVFDVLDAAKSLAGNPPDVKAGMQSLAKAVGEISPDLRARMVGAFADKLHLPSWAKDTLVTAAGLLGNAEVGKSLGDAFDALKRGDVAGFAAGIAHTGRTIAQTAPEVAKSFLNSLSKIPGSIGKLFADPQLNAAMVDSGAAGAMFNAFEKIAHGDIGGALNEIASAAGDLLGSGKHFNVAGHDLPFGQEGIENFTRLFGRFVDALPDKIKAKITQKAAEFAAKAGLQSIPIIGNVASGISAIGSAKDLYDALNKNPKDPVQIALSAGQLGLDVAGVVPGLNSVTGPLKMVLGTATVIKGAADLIGDMKEFQQGLMGA